MRLHDVKSRRQNLSVDIVYLSVSKLAPINAAGSSTRQLLPVFGWAKRSIALMAGVRGLPTAPLEVA